MGTSDSDGWATIEVIKKRRKRLGWMMGMGNKRTNGRATRAG
jgi:hypothetical protein